jgi:hypothetical protein
VVWGDQNRAKSKKSVTVSRQSIIVLFRKSLVQ